MSFVFAALRVAATLVAGTSGLPGIGSSAIRLTGLPGSTRSACVTGCPASARRTGLTSRAAGPGLATASSSRCTPSSSAAASSAPAA